MTGDAHRGATRRADIATQLLVVPAVVTPLHRASAAADAQEKVARV